MSTYSTSFDDQGFCSLSVGDSRIFAVPIKKSRLFMGSQRRDGTTQVRRVLRLAVTRLSQTLYRADPPACSPELRDDFEALLLPVPILPALW